MTAMTANAHRAPDYGEIYLLVVGVVLGIFLGPAVLGKLKPDVHANMFPSLPAAYQARARFERRHDNEKAMRIVQLKATGVSDAAMKEIDVLAENDELAAEDLQTQAMLASAHRHRGRLLALVAAIAALMVVEATAGATSVSLGRRLAAARYAVMAIWLALVIAQPDVIDSVPVLFTLLILAVAVVAAAVPMPRGQTVSE